MPDNVLNRALKKSAVAAVVCVLGALLVLWPSFARAAQNNGQFSVRITLQSNQQQNSGLCRSASQIGAFGIVVIVECDTGTIASYDGNPTDLPWTTMQDNSSFRFVANVTRAGELLGPLDKYDSFAEAGTITSWRLVKLDKMSYFEMMMHW